tara:strand:+ start:183 stop:818 length:636 start_codon:yes stop_codon:yes gene_type:complete
MALNINGTTGISGVDGSVSAPALTGTDSNTGITFPAADTIKFATGGVERMSITNSGISGIEAGIEMFDTYDLTTTKSLSAGTNFYLNADFTRGSVFKGTGLTKSSEVFSFPSTGLYRLAFTSTTRIDNTQSSRYGVTSIFVTTNNGSSFTEQGAVNNATPALSNATYSSGYSIHYMDVTDISNQKFKCSALIEVSGVLNAGFLEVMRLGDT